MSQSKICLSIYAKRTCLFEQGEMPQYSAFNKQDGHGNIVYENGGPEPMKCIVNQDEFIVETIAAYSEYLNNATSNESSSACPMWIEKPKDEDIRIKEPNVKHDCVRYTVQDKVRFFV